MNEYNKLPDIESYNLTFNPTLLSPNSCYELPFYQTRESLMDIEEYKRFLDNSITRFRRSKAYKHYKGFLIDQGMDRCQFHGNITNEMATIEMHHNMITIFDIALIITEHIINTKGLISTFDLSQILKQEHKANRIQLVMLSLTPHQLYHNNSDFFIHPDMCIGKWYEFLERYNRGITVDIAFKIMFYLKRSIEEGGSNDHDLLKITEMVKDWSQFNECHK